jgi:hypothetical protein
MIRILLLPGLPEFQWKAEVPILGKRGNKIQVSSTGTTRPPGLQILIYSTLSAVRSSGQRLFYKEPITMEPAVGLPVGKT